jgi:hypothetical protein
MVDNMKAVLVLRTRRWLTDDALVEAVVWEVPSPVPGSAHNYKYRLAFVVKDVCVLRYDNERCKGDHKHVGDTEQTYLFTTREALLTDFFQDVERMMP